MTELLIVFAVIAVLVALNGMFVAAEFAIIGASRAALATRAEAGDPLARRIAGILNEPVQLDRYIATAQIGITFASLGLGMYGEHTLAVFFADWLHAVGISGLGATMTAHGIASVLAITVITYLHIVFGEMIPKALALTRAERVALWVARPMLVIGFVMLPLVRLLNLTGNLLLGLVGFKRGRSSGHYVGADELGALARESRNGGLLSAESERIFLELSDFSELTATQAMVPRVRVAGIPLGADETVLRDIVTTHRHTRYPVYDGSLDQIVGTVHIKDVLGLLRVGERLGQTAVRETAYLPETATLDDVLSAMDRAHNQMVVVMDEHGGTAGIITIEDICAEAVGDVEEGAEDVPDVLPVGPARYQVQGTVRLDTLGVIVGTALEHAEVDTVSGLVLSELGRPPVIGDRLEWQGLRLEVTALYGRGVRQVTLTLAPPPSALTPAPAAAPPSAPTSDPAPPVDTASGD